MRRKRNLQSNGSVVSHSIRPPTPKYKIEQSNEDMSDVESSKDPEGI